MGHYILALEFGTTKIACAAAESIDDSVRIIAYREAPSKGVTRGDIVNIRHVSDIARSLITEISAEEGGLTFDVTAAGMSIQFVKMLTRTNERTRKQPDQLIGESEIQELTDEMKNSKVENDEQIIDVIPQFYNIDNEIFGEIDPAGSMGTAIEGYYKLAVSKKRSITYLNSVFEQLGITPDLVMLRSNASGYAVLNDEERETGVVLVDMGGGNTEVTIIKDHIIKHNAIIPFGGESITNDISTTFGISRKDAEILKHQYGSCYVDLYASNDKLIVIPDPHNEDMSKKIPLRQLVMVIEARAVEILEAVRYEIRNSGCKDDISGKMVLTGGGAQLTHLGILAKAMTGFNVRVAYPSDLSLAEESCKEILDYKASTVAGLTIAGMKFINAHPEIYGEEAEAKKQEEARLKEEEEKRKEEEEIRRKEEEEELARIEEEDTKKKKETRKKGGSIFKRLWDDMFKEDNEA